MSRDRVNPDSVVEPARPRPLWIAIGIAIALVIALVVWLLLSGGGGGGGAGNASGTGTGAPTVYDAATSTPIPAPSPGAVQPTPAPTGGATPQVTAAPVPLDEVGLANKDVTVELTKIESVTGESVIPGEVAGPALRVTVVAHNGSAQDIATPIVVANLYYGPDRTAGNPFLQPGGQPFPASIPAGATQTGVYLFSVPEDERDQVLIEVNMLFEANVVLFEGAVAP